MYMPFPSMYMPYNYPPYYYGNMNSNPYMSQPHQQYQYYPPHPQQPYLPLPPLSQQQQQQYQSQYGPPYLFPPQRPPLLYQTPPPPPPPLSSQQNESPRNTDLNIRECESPKSTTSTIVPLTVLPNHSHSQSSGVDLEDKSMKFIQKTLNIAFNNMSNSTSNIDDLLSTALEKLDIKHNMSTSLSSTKTGIVLAKNSQYLTNRSTQTISHDNNDLLLEYAAKCCKSVQNLLENYTCLLKEGLSITDSLKRLAATGDALYHTSTMLNHLIRTRENLNIIEENFGTDIPFSTELINEYRLRKQSKTPITTATILPHLAKTSVNVIKSSLVPTISQTPQQSITHSSLSYESRESELKHISFSLREIYPPSSK
ncbi:unnamed protein product [Didymodactylos carnosus]|uniref:Uncharacterized protein n=1 Tax=Didymodactylos carnosus TaxID=1234261 RepID=A0A813W984_9BILA|nr:unnamed protein product [Didymodactylos carnosus]CAF3642299.1 unnamed protein product [Didymodactylos carnosus]